MHRITAHTESGFGHCTDDHHIGTRARHRFHQAVYVTRHFHNDQEAGQTETRRLQFSQSALDGNLGE